MKTYAEINEKIKKGTAVVLTAEEVSELSKTLSPKEIAEKVDVVTTATFGAMCSSGAFLNFGHSNPPIRMEKIELNGIRVSGGLAALQIVTHPLRLMAEPISSKTWSMVKTLHWKPGEKGRIVIPANI